MRFSRPNKAHDEPEINLIPFIDILLVVLIFLIATTSYAKFGQLQVNLPKEAVSELEKNKPNELSIAVSAEGQYSLAGKSYVSSADVSLALRALTSNKDSLVVIHADAKASHQAVVSLMGAAQQAGFNRLAFATEQAENPR